MELSPALSAGLDLSAGPVRLCFGLREASATVRHDPILNAGVLRLSPDLLQSLRLPAPLQISAFKSGSSSLRLGPLVGLLIAERKLETLLDGSRDTIYCRYCRYAEEAGAALCFFTAAGVAPDGESVTGYRHRCRPDGGCDWEAVHIPFPRVIYDRCFGIPGREQSAQVRRTARKRGAAVVNSLPKLTKLQTFAALSPYRELTEHLPMTSPLTPETLAAAMQQRDDLYLKPDHLYKGKGVCRLLRTGSGWLLQSREEAGNAVKRLAGDEAAESLAPLLASDACYLLQEGVDLATYLGNRYDFRSLVQKDGQGRWQVTGLVARIAPEQSVITSPRSGGQVAPAELALRDSFPDRWESVMAELERVSLLVAERLDQQLGPWAELGLDLGVEAFGRVRLIEANGKPLRVSLERLRDPEIGERINRYPIHYAAWLDLQGEVTPCDP